jgi:hypothetical protein
VAICSVVLYSHAFPAFPSDLPLGGDFLMLYYPNAAVKLGQNDLTFARAYWADDEQLHVHEHGKE